MARKKTSQRKNTKPSRLPQLLILGGVILLALVIVALKSQSDARPNPPLVHEGELPESQLQLALQAGQPTLAFFHSNNCDQCLIMIETVGQVYPEFASSVTLVDVDVYDNRNHELLRQARIQVIPTLILFDRQSQGQVNLGVMEADDLRHKLAGLSEGDKS